MLSLYRKINIFFADLHHWQPMFFIVSHSKDFFFIFLCLFFGNVGNNE